MRHQSKEYEEDLPKMQAKKGSNMMIMDNDSSEDERNIAITKKNMNLVKISRMTRLRLTMTTTTRWPQKREKTINYKEE